MNGKRRLREAGRRSEREWTSDGRWKERQEGRVEGKDENGSLRQEGRVNGERKAEEGRKEQGKGMDR